MKDDRDADLRAELADRADLKAEPPEQSMAELARMNAARTEVVIETWYEDGVGDVAVLSCGHEMRTLAPFGNRHPVGTRLSCGKCRNAKLAAMGDRHEQVRE